MVSRIEILSRAGTVWEPGTVPYSQVAVHQPDGYRQDCSGYVSMCWALPPAGENTVTLVTEGWMVEIPPGDLQPGDAIGLCGPGTAGDAGHIQLVDHLTATGLVIWEQAGGTNGPTRRTLKRIPAGYKAYRLSTMEEDMTPAQAEQFDDLIWREDAAASGSLTIRGGRYAGESYALNVTLASISAQLEQLHLAAGGAHTHTATVGPATPVE